MTNNSCCKVNEKCSIICRLFQQAKLVNTMPIQCDQNLIQSITSSTQFQNTTQEQESTSTSPILIHTNSKEVRIHDFFSAVENLKENRILNVNFFSE